MGRLRVLGNARVSVELADGNKKRATLQFGRMIAVSKVVYKTDPEYIDVHYANGNVIKEVKASFFEIHGDVDIEYESVFKPIENTMDKDVVDDEPGDDKIEDGEGSSDDVTGLDEFLSYTRRKDTSDDSDD